MFGLTHDQAVAGLGAMKRIALAHGRFADEERDLLRACAAALESSVDIESLMPCSPAAAAEAFPDAAWRRRVMQALMATAMVDGEATPDEMAELEAFRSAFGVEEPWLRALHHAVDGHLNLLRIDLARRNPLLLQMFGESWREEGARGVWRVLKAMRLHGELDAALAWRFKRLGLLPEGTFGRTYWEHMTSRGFAFPGEPAGIHLRAVHHDLTHVLTGYDTDPAGECQIAAFYAGYKGDDPFAFVFFTLVMFQMGIALNPGVITPSRLQWHPDLVIHAMKRGAGIKRDLTDHWDFWPDLELPIEEVRARYGLAGEGVPAST